ncbi:SDR family NAD(P)-dependent oxidoreductase [Kamptonema cortianum]|uniref:SDR family NAD(P)-dependent oxidoreductase n=1 Tax=Geitlerinema calcuttense NRMC-F 0142 TaxID=2922238 RepID=A0ABT7LZX1_9CYAN|nr:type I polyketide synthase [Geitlerinema calcuttense]MDK3158297.1 SDR family NAD(P)-dependent oxidoreductase [Kamptonema cortianum]MDL5057561.1 SDR family NAD(P)-dependent oxidoreductase [Geitlerinema calcuttense NRMC-F 0142]
MNFPKTGLEIAIIGLSGRFPESQNLNNFWQKIKAGERLIKPFSQGSQKFGAILENIDQFDANFFGFSPREAEILDPQHRLFLECAWEALENAGYDSEQTEKLIGVYAGVGMGTYLFHNLYPHPGLVESQGFLQTLISTDKDYVPTRVSYKLNLTGPSISVGTACSSSLVAVHLACQSLLSGECDMALAAGVSIKVPQNERTLSPEGIISPDGECRAFDARANGTVGGNGVGVVVLKRLEEALNDRDRIYAVIKGSAIDNDGSQKVGYTAPSQLGQTRAIQAAHLMAEVEPETITYLEAHGTGTPLGDPIEVAAMTAAFGTSKTQFCAIGSVKTNVGHLDAAAGIVGLIKTALALHEKVLPPSLNFETPNPQIDFANSPFYVNTQLTPWETSGFPRRAGVSSFGFGGTNVHAVLEEAPELSPVSPSRSWQLLALSAKTEAALERATANLGEYLHQQPDLDLADVAYTLHLGRRAFEYRRFAVVSNRADAIQQLGSLTTGCADSNPSVVFMFTGQGSQYANMGRELYEKEAIFRETCDRAFCFLQSHCGLDLRSRLYSDAAEQLQQTAIAQPALFVVEYALAQLWMSWGIQPAALIGHSIGEYVAATLAGVFSLEDALTLVTRRGQLMQQQPPGAMLAVSLAADEIPPMLPGQLSIAASNSPKACVISGPEAEIAQFAAQLAQQDIPTRRLQTSHAFHSAMMDEIVAPFAECVRQVTLNAPQIPLISNVTGTWLTAQQATDPHYWGQHLRQGVQFAPGIAELLADSPSLFLEVGPGRTLTTLVKQQAPQCTVLPSLPHPKEPQSEIGFILNTLGKLWLAGVRVDWQGFHREETRRRVPLPSYPFERQRYWIDPPAEATPTRLVKKREIGQWFYLPSWQRSRFLPSPAEPSGWVLVFVDEAGFGDSRSVSAAFRRNPCGNRILEPLSNRIVVKVGSEFAQLDEFTYTLNPHHREDYVTLLAHLSRLGQFPTQILHLWNYTQADLDFERAQTLGFYSLLHLAQALGDQPELSILVVSSGLQDVMGTEDLAPVKATLLGAVQVISQEYPNLHCRSLDLEGGELTAKQVHQLLAELASDSTERIVAYRQQYRWVQRFEPIELTDRSVEFSRWRQGGVYLIVGGLGRIGSAIAQFLAQTYQAKLILTGRSGDRLNPSQAEALRALEAAGAEVLIVRADVANLEQMRQVVQQAETRFGSLNGVIHAAGKVGDTLFCPIPQIDEAAVEPHFRPKIQGLQVLQTLLQDKPLDFCLLCSSLSSVLGGWGTAAYSAANLYMDAWACQQNRNARFPWIVVNWDIWQGSVTSSLAEFALTPEAGLDALQRILSQAELDRVIVSTTDLKTRLRQAFTAQPPEKPPLHVRTQLPASYLAPRTPLEELLVRLWEDLLGIQPIGVCDNFFELNGDSLLATRSISQIEAQTQIKLPIQQLFETPTIAGLAEYLETVRSLNQQLQPLTLTAALAYEEGEL